MKSLIHAKSDSGLFLANFYFAKFSLFSKKTAFWELCHEHKHKLREEVKS